jgi:hypothetical protein
VGHTLGVEVWVPSLIAVGGTLLGSATTYLFQSQSMARTERFDRAERRRQERLTAYGDFIASVTALRQGVITLWFRQRQEQRAGDTSEQAWAAHLDSDRLGAVADHAKFRVRLVTDDPDLGELAETVLEPISEMWQAADRKEIKALEKRSQETLANFITAARRELSG